MSKYNVEVHVAGKKYKKQIECSYSQSTGRAYSYANGLSKKHKKPWTFLHIGKAEPKRRKGILPF